jgi:uncharacterized membrane protein YvbJ
MQEQLPTNFKETIFGGYVNKCSVCGHQRNDQDIKCPECGSFYSKIAEIIAEQEAQEEMQTLRGRCKIILNADDVKHALLAELKLIRAGLTKKGMFALFVIFVFVFALVVSVL